MPFKFNQVWFLYSDIVFFFSSKPSDTPPDSSLDLSEDIPLLSFLGYTFCPGNCVFGPWVKYSDYMEIFINPRWVSQIDNLLLNLQSYPSLQHFLILQSRCHYEFVVMRFWTYTIHYCKGCKKCRMCWTNVYIFNLNLTTILKCHKCLNRLWNGTRYVYR